RQLSPDTVLDELAGPRTVRSLRRNFGHIVYVEKSLSTHQAGKSKAWANAFRPLRRGRWSAMHCCGPNKLAIGSQQDSVFGAAKAVRLVQDRVEDRRDSARGAVDGAQHLGQRRLPRQRLVALSAAFVELSLQLRTGAPKIGGRLVERRGHWSARASNGTSSET